MRSLLFLGSCLLFIACGNSQPVHRSMELSWAENGSWKSLYPPSVYDPVSAHIVSQVYEGLMSLDPEDLRIIPCLARKWEVNESQTVFTFYLRKGVTFHDNSCFNGNKGREVTAADVKYCFERIFEDDPDNIAYYMVKGLIKGGDEYYNAKTKKAPFVNTVSGLAIVNDSIVQIALNYPFAEFLNLLTAPAFYIYPKEAVIKYGDDLRLHGVGTGPFIISALTDTLVTLKKNNKYWARDPYGNALPFIDQLNILMDKNAVEQEKLLGAGKTDLLFFEGKDFYLLPDSLLMRPELHGLRLLSTPRNAAYYYGFSCKQAPFDSRRVRLAFNYAIDRKEIIKKRMNGIGDVLQGIVPYGIPGFDPSLLDTFPFDPVKAQQLLAEAGYPKGKKFPKITLTINPGGSSMRHSDIAAMIQNMLKENLGIEVQVDVYPFAQLMENIDKGEAVFWRTAWISDYPSPYEYLRLFYGKNVPSSFSEKSYPNTTRFTNSGFDALIDKANKTGNEKERNALYKEASKVLISEAPFLPLYCEQGFLLLDDRLKGVYLNSMFYLDLRNAWMVFK
jgi:oligopeptide transport system substrate-binding protein